MRILVAGGAGYIGSVLVPSLLERAYEVDVINLLYSGITSWQKPTYSVLENAGLKALNLDIMTHWEDGLRRYLKKIGAF
jgi:nucleoside-diphosphate-sugar epimerase